MNYPKHIAFIPDGNRTWAKERDLPQMAGHMEWQNTAIKLMKYIFGETPIEVATFWGLSTENSKKRSEEELDYLSELYELVLWNINDFLVEQKVSFRWIGSPEWLPEKVVNVLESCSQKHNYDSPRTLVIAINYWGQDEIVRGVKSMVASWITEDEVTAESIGKSLDLWDLPCVELVVRTKGEYAKRTSGFMSWWIGYSEIFFSEKYYPDLLPPVLEEILTWFDGMAKHRNYGK